MFVSKTYIDNLTHRICLDNRQIHHKVDATLCTYCRDYIEPLPFQKSSSI